MQDFPDYVIISLRILKAHKFQASNFNKCLPMEIKHIVSGGEHIRLFKEHFSMYRITGLQSRKIKVKLILK